MNRQRLKWGLISIALIAPFTIAAQTPEPEPAATEEETSEAAEIEDESDENEEAVKTDQDSEDTEEASEIDDFIPSEMISEDLAVDLPVDI